MAIPPVHTRSTEGGARATQRARWVFVFSRDSSVMALNGTGWHSFQKIHVSLHSRFPGAEAPTRPAQHGGAAESNSATASSMVHL